jgi:two-component system OmpR family response regulator
MRILLVEDDAALANAVLGYLQGKQFLVDLAADLGQARSMVSLANYSAVLLDLNLPDGDGLQLLPTIVAQAEPASVIVVTARDQVSDRIRGLDAGADDYLIKPYDPEELLARLRAVERRRSHQTSSVVTRGEVSIDLTREVVKANGFPVVMTPKEWALLRVLASRAQQVHSRERLLDALYHWDDSSDSNTLEVFISRLRRKLGTALIQTVRGTGYRLGPP